MGDFNWPNGRRCAVTLTYDDALPEHFESVAPLLNSRGLTGTFYVFPHCSFSENTEGWRKVAAMGHELGNHSLFHPCRREPVERFGWLPAWFDLCDYSIERWEEEMRIANYVLHLIDGKSIRSFGNTCCNTTVGRPPNQVSLENSIRKMFAAGRGPLNSTIIQPATANLAALGHFTGDARPFAHLKERIEKAMESNGWIIFMIHGVGNASHRLFLAENEHATLVNYLGDQSEQIWTASMVEVVSYLKTVSNGG